MATPVVVRPAPSLLERCRVGQPVSAAWARRNAQGLGFLRAYNVQQGGSHQYLSNTLLAAATKKYPILYHRRDGISMIRCVISAHTGTDGNRFQCKTYINGSLAQQFGGTGIDLILPSTRHRQAGHHFLHQGVSASGVVVVSAEMIATDQCNGLRSFSVCEIPRAAVDPVRAATEPGFNEASIEPRNRMHTPTSPDTADGLRRIWYEMDRARTQFRRCQQIATSEDTATDTIQATGTGYAPLNWRAHAGDPVFYTRPRRLYLESTPNSCTWYIRYYWSGGTNAKVRCTATSLTTGTVATSVITLTTAGAWTVQSAAVNLPVDGVYQICALTFDADADGSVIDLSNIAIFDTET